MLATCTLCFDEAFVLVPPVLRADDPPGGAASESLAEGAALASAAGASPESDRAGGAELGAELDALGVRSPHGMDHPRRTGGGDPGGDPWARDAAVHAPRRVRGTPCTRDKFLLRSCAGGEASHCGGGVDDATGESGGDVGRDGGRDGGRDIDAPGEASASDAGAPVGGVPVRAGEAAADARTGTDARSKEEGNTG